MPRVPTTFPRLDSPKSCVGKTIVATTSRFTDTIGFRFDDGTYFYAKTEDNGLDAWVLDCKAEFNEIEEAHELGIVDAVEFARLDAEQKAQQERWDRAQYEAFKKRFESTS